MKKIIFACLTVFLCKFSFAGDNHAGSNKTDSRLISGKVIDKKSGEEIAGAEIKINDEIIYSDLNGNFSTFISQIKTEASVSFISYIDAKINIDAVAYNSIVIELEAK